MNQLEQILIALLRLPETGYTSELIMQNFSMNVPTFLEYERTLADVILCIDSETQIEQKLDGRESDRTSFGVSIETLTSVRAYFHKHPSSPHIKSNIELVLAIRQAYTTGDILSQEIARMIRESVAQVERYAPLTGIDFLQLGVKERRIHKLRCLYAQGVRYIAEAATIMNLNPITIAAYNEQSNIGFVWENGVILRVLNNRTAKRKPALDVKIALGKSLQELATFEDSSRQSILQYLQRTHQHKAWKSQRQSVKETEKQEKITRTYLLSQLTKILTQHMLEKSSWPQRMARTYLLKKPASRLSYHQLHTVFSRYEQAKQNNRLVSMQKLGEDLGIGSPAVTIGKILASLHLQPLFGNKYHYTPTLESLRAIQRGASTSLAHCDIAFYLGICKNIVHEQLHNHHRNRHQIGIGTNYYGWGLTYRYASLIYEANDLGFTPLEIKKLYTYHPNMIMYALHHRETLAQRIITALHIIFPGSEISTPYLTVKPETLLKNNQLDH